MIKSTTAIFLCDTVPTCDLQITDPNIIANFSQLAIDKWLNEGRYLWMTQAEFRCNEPDFYLLQGESFTSCQADAKFDYPAPKCGIVSNSAVKN